MPDNLTVIQLKSSTDESVECSNKNDRTIIIKPEPEPESTSELKSEQSDKTIIYNKSRHNSDTTRIFNRDTGNPESPDPDKKNNNLVPINTGSILKNRFVLEEVLGVGGMGKVYKATDLRKKEAHDKNPYIAIKVLNDEFREHPESLIALQREARKSQLLSHPNIVNVHDFDRDGDVVYMTMELLQGRPLDQLIAEDFPYGMPEKEATPIINSIANAVLYAHQHGIIHSDLKPSNVFITEDNNAKIFDFGIARACQLSQGQLDGINDKMLFESHPVDSTLFDPTLFDPTKLGALTPTYASLEMLQGKAPEPHDDIFSIACVFYELLTGNHPYNRLPADKAKEQALQAKKISELDKFKAKAIFKALEFDGKNRFANLELFIKDYNYKKKSKRPVIVSTLTLLLILLIIYFPQLQEQYHFNQQSQFISSVNSLDTKPHKDNLFNIQQHIKTLDDKTQNYVLENIKNKWLILVQNKIDYLIDGDMQNYQYDEAFDLLKITQSYYPDSAQVARLFESFEKQKFIEINRLNSQFNELLETLQFSQFLSHSIEQQQILQIIASVKRIEAAHPLVKDQRLLLIYQDNIERLLAEYKIEEANDLLAKVQLIFPNEILLQNLLDKSKSLKINKQNEVIVSNNSDIPELSVSSLKQKLAALISDSEVSDQWDNEVTIIYTQLSKKLGHRSIWLNEKKQTLASLYLQKSVSMRDEQRLVEARRFLENAKEYNNGIFGLDDEEAILLALENIVRVKHKAKQRLAKIDGLKTSLTTQLKAQEMEVSLRTYEDLKRILGRNDPYISREARQKIAQAYYKQARQMFTTKEYQQTIEIVTNGLKFSGQHSGLRALRKKALKQQNRLKNSLLMVQQSAQKTIIKEGKKPAENKTIEQEQTTAIDQCKAKYAGYGKRKRANCYDMINNQFKAPTLVVLPAINSSQNAFAISKYEITIKDYNFYCLQSGECSEKKGNSLLPVTGISIDRVKKYVNWLSKITFRKYSIPTSGQWLHAAKTNNTAQYNDVNCRIKFGSKLLKGQNLLAVNTGQSNPWGIMNIIGNAREFIIDNTMTIARGGAHIDSIKDCTVDNKQTNIAQGDSSTGFRVVREVKQGRYASINN